MYRIIENSKAGLAWNLSHNDNQVILLKAYFMQMIGYLVDDFRSVKERGFADPSHPLNNIRLVQANDHKGSYLTITIKPR